MTIGRKTKNINELKSNPSSNPKSPYLKTTQPDHKFYNKFQQVRYQLVLVTTSSPHFSSIKMNLL